MANGKVVTGFSFPRVALYESSGNTVSYSSGRPLARGVEVSFEPETSDDNIFYADNQAAESAAGLFTRATCTLTVDQPLIAAEKMLMGIPAQTGDWTAYDKDQNVPYVGIGFIVRYMSDAKTTYVPVILPKCKFNQFTINAATQEEDIDWQTTELTATVLRSDDEKGTWKFVGKDYDTEAEALAAIDAKLNVQDSQPTPAPVTTYTVTQNLTNVTSSYTGTSVDENASISATLTAESGYTIDSVTVEMGGADITATAYDDTTNSVSITAVTGNVVITATAA